ncbi:MAG: GTP-binding protein [Candidatus Magnetoglobus multicellularis str. Araruama]|uniref:GTPase Obg n=1 Tax=Candidatus Magnetoglobus multicellularis str. Araruama TaxID=890399 RepID=A0A1V1PHQ2_9BACT|nr:MAG: GTP-binding protein [Candidatus Magnetoglobus multicellularis str. Araruama]
MKFIDEAFINVQSGDGGKGCVSFRRERCVPRGGPNGGDGGRGGHVILKAVPEKRTLYQFRFQRQFKAGKGKNGLGSHKTGANADDLVIEVPVGTIVADTETREILTDFKKAHQSYIVAEGGRGGKGNKHFATSTHRTPRFSQPGESGQSRSLHLELKLLADVGLIGLPNAGKSTLISVMTAARPKIADYPFTTLTPSIGIVQTDTIEPYAIADIPGIIEGAHKGIGLGFQFLKHIERTRVLVHLIDVAAMDIDNPLTDYQTIMTELSSYNPSLSQKKQIVVLNKMDLPDANRNANLFQKQAPDIEIYQISAATGEGIKDLAINLGRMI